jgi:SAM-dependent methyltransferase
MGSYDNVLKAQKENVSIPSLYCYFQNLYAFVRANVKNSEKILEIGAGAGVSKIFLEKYDIVRTDYLRGTDDSVLGEIDVQSLPYEGSSFDVVFGIDFLHHIPEPFTALREMKRVVFTEGHSSGKILMIEPHVSFVSFPIYRMFHEEKTSKKIKIDYYSVFSNSDPQDGDQSIPGYIFLRKQGKEILNEIFPPTVYKINITFLNILAFFATGGINRPFGTPAWLVRMFLFVENLFPNWVMKLLGSRMLIVIEKRNRKEESDAS